MSIHDEPNYFQIVDCENHPLCIIKTMNADEDMVLDNHIEKVQYERENYLLYHMAPWERLVELCESSGLERIFLETKQL